MKFDELLSKEVPQVTENATVVAREALQGVKERLETAVAEIRERIERGKAWVAEQSNPQHQSIGQFKVEKLIDEIEPLLKLRDEVGEILEGDESGMYAYWQEKQKIIAEEKAKVEGLEQKAMEINERLVKGDEWLKTQVEPHAVEVGRSRIAKLEVQHQEAMDEWGQEGDVLLGLLKLWEGREHIEDDPPAEPEETVAE